MGNRFELGKVYSNPYVTAFKPQVDEVDSIKLSTMVNEINPSFNKKLLKMVDDYIDYRVGSPEYIWALSELLQSALTDSNFHKTAKKVTNIFKRADEPDNALDLSPVLKMKGEAIAKIAKWDGHDIIDGFAYVAAMRIGGSMLQPITDLKLVESKSNLKESTSKPKFKKGDTVNYIPKLSGLNPKKKLEIDTISHSDGDELTSAGWYYGFKGTSLRASETDIKLSESLTENKRPNEYDWVQYFVEYRGQKYPYYISYIDSTHVAIGMDKPKGNSFSGMAVWHIGQLRDKEYYEPMLKWMKTGDDSQINKKSFNESIEPITESVSPEVVKLVNGFVKSIAKKYGYSEQDAVYAIQSVLDKGKFNELKESTTEPQIITQLRDVMIHGYQTLKDPKTGRKMKVDSYSASVIVKVYDGLSDINKEKFSGAGLLGMQSMAFKLIK
jgi:hypothetical protein